jgi:MFS family permease
METRESEVVTRGGFRGAMSLLKRNRDFRNLYFAQLISFGGDWFLLVALYGLVLDLTDSPLMASLILVAQLVPYFLFVPVAGVLADRVNRQALMVCSDVVRAGLCLGFFLVGPGTVWLIFVLQALLALFTSTFEPAAEAAVPNLVDPKDLSLANSLVGSAWGTMLAIGAALGGVIAGTLGKDAAFIGDSISFVASAALLITIRRPFSEARPAEHDPILKATAETISYARKDRRVLALLAVKGGFGLAGGILVLLPVFARDVYHQGDVGTGILYGMRGVGALIGPFIGRRVAGPTAGGMFRAIGFALFCFPVFYAIFPWMPFLILAGLCTVGAHVGGGAQWTLSTYGLQRFVPDRIRGRVFSFDFAFVTLSIALSNLAAGWAAEQFGPEATMIALAGIGFVYAVGWWFWTGRLRAPATAAEARS